MPSIVSTGVSETDKKHLESVSSISNLSEVMQKVLQQYQAELRALNVILRCDQLPLVKGNFQRMCQLFGNLIGLIIKLPPAGEKLFLHVSCSEESSIIKYESFFSKSFTIQFHTNVNAGSSWMLLNQEKLNECKEIITESGGHFTANEIKNAGRLFSIVLPGKIQ